MLVRRHLLSLLLRKDNDRRVGKMPACEAHQDHHRIINLVKGRPSRQLGGLHNPSKCNKDGHRLRRDQNQARSE
jgi:hypothetical protein